MKIWTEKIFPSKGLSLMSISFWHVQMNMAGLWIFFFLILFVSSFAESKDCTIEIASLFVSFLSVSLPPLLYSIYNTQYWYFVLSNCCRLVRRTWYPMSCHCLFELMLILIHAFKRKSWKNLHLLLSNLMLRWLPFVWICVPACVYA